MSFDLLFMQGEVVTKLSEQPSEEIKSGKPDKAAPGEASEATKTATPVGTEKGQGDGGQDKKAPVLLPKPSDDKASDSDSEQSQRRRSARKGLTKVAGEGSKSGDEGGEKAVDAQDVEGRKAEGALKATPVMVKDAKVVQDALEKQMEVKEDAAGPAPPENEMEIAGAKDKVAEMPKLPLQSPARIMKARKSFPSKKARGMSAEDDPDNDEDNLMEYVELSPELSDQAESEDAFDMRPQDEDLPDRNTNSDTTVDERSIPSEPEDSLGSESSSSVPSSNSGKTARKSVPVDKPDSKKTANARASKNLKSQSERVVQLHVGGEEAMDIGAASRKTPMDTSTVDFDPLSAGTSHTKAKASIKTSGSTAKGPGHIPEQSDQEQLQTQTASEPVAGTAAESHLSLSGTSTPVADFPVGNAGSMTPDSRAAFAKGLSVKRSTRQRKPTHFGQHSRRKRQKNVSDSGKHIHLQMISVLIGFVLEDICVC